MILECILLTGFFIVRPDGCPAIGSFFLGSRLVCADEPLERAGQARESFHDEGGQPHKYYELVLVFSSSL